MRPAELVAQAANDAPGLMSITVAKVQRDRIMLTRIA
jgi:hypothetical protein